MEYNLRAYTERLHRITATLKRLNRQREKQRYGKMASIVDLPPEMLCEIFLRFVEIKDLFVCSMVCKAWNAVFRRHFLPQIRGLALTAQKYSEKSILQRSEMLGGRTRRTFWTMQSDYWNSFGGRYLTIANQLKYLDVEIRARPEGYIWFELPNLEVLFIRFENDTHLVEVNCPKLKDLTYRERHTVEDLLIVHHPDSIRTLTTNMIGRKVSKFEKLENLFTDNLGTVDDLISVPSLKKICYTGPIIGNVEVEGCLIKGSKGMINGLLNKAKQRAIPLNDFLFGGFRFDQEKNSVNKLTWRRIFEPFLNADEMLQHNAKAVVPEALAHRSYWRYRNYMTPELASKLTHVESAKISSPVDCERNLLRFLGNLKALRTLNLSNYRLSQAFYDMLPDRTPRLFYLIIGRAVDRNYWNIDLSFLGELPQLVNVNVTAMIGRESAKDAIEWLMSGTRRELQFETNYDYFVITAQDKRFKVISRRCAFLICGNVLGLLSLAYPTAKVPENEVYERYHIPGEPHESDDEDYVHLRTAKRRKMRSRSMELNDSFPKRLARDLSD